MPGFPRILDAVADAYRTRRTEVEDQASALADHLRAQLAVPAGTRDVEPAQLEAAVARLACDASTRRTAASAARRSSRRRWSSSSCCASWRRTGDDEALADGDADARRHGRRRHLRPARRRLRALQHRRALARAALREDALRQRAARARLPRGLPGHRRRTDTRASRARRSTSCCASCAPTTAASPRPSTPTARARRVASTPGRTTSSWRRSPMRASTMTTPRAGRLLGRDRRGNWEGTNVLHVAGTGARGRARRARARGPARGAGAADPPGARREAARGLERAGAARARPRALVLGDERVPGRDPARSSPSSSASSCATATACGAPPATAAPTRRPSARTTSPSPTACSTRTPRSAMPSRCCLPGGWSTTALRDFWDDEAGTFVDTSDEHERTVARPRGLVDNATPSANASAPTCSCASALLTGDEDFARRARSILRAVAPALERQPSAFGRMLCAADRLLGEQIDVVVAGDGDDGAAPPRGRRSVRPRPRAHRRRDRRRARRLAALRGQGGP